MTEEESRVVEEVYRFWFGGSQQVNYKTKWFPDGSTDLQATADRIVFEQFGDVFYSAIHGQYMHWQEHTRSCVALIVVLDQFSRHICRLKGKQETETDQKKADELALDVARRLFGDSESPELLGLSVAEYVFSLMPLRHTATVNNLSFVLERLEAKEAAEAKAMELLNRFRKQTVRRLQHLQDRAKLEATADILEREAFVADESDVMSHPLVRTTEAFLAEHLGLGLGLGTGRGTSGGGARNAASKGGKGSSSKDSGAADRDRDGAGDAQRGRGAPSVTLLISLSGGVDSMVISKILRLLQIHRPQLRIARIMAIHIDYGNRPESADEAAYIQRWCEGEGDEDEDGEGGGPRSAMLGGLLCRVRRVEEVTRGVTSRDEYEKVSRDIRYGFYRTCIAEARQLQGGEGEEGGEGGEGEGEGGEGRISGVIFGHHLGDVQENVISNVMRGSGPLQLSGMAACSVTNGVAVWRPLLAHTKDAIYDFAHRYGVPYFKDSTPSWSTRGKLRSHLLPLLLDMYGSGCLHNLTQLALESDATRALVQDNLYEPFMRSVQRRPCGVSVNVLPYRGQPQCFWREALKQLMHSMNMAMVRDSAVGNFVERLQRAAPGTKSGAGVLPGWLELRKGAHSYLTAEGDLVVLRDGVFRRHASAALSSTTLNQRRQQALSQARKQRLAAGGVSTAAMVDAAQQQVTRLKAELERTVGGLLTVTVDLATGRLSCDPAVLSALCSEEYPDVKHPAGTAHTPEGRRDDKTVKLGPWAVECSLHRAPAQTGGEEKEEGVGGAGRAQLSGLVSVLPGAFSYAIPLPSPSPVSGPISLQLAFQRDQIQNLCEEVQLQSGVLTELTTGAAGVPATVPAAVEGGDPAADLLPLVLPSAVVALDGRVRSGLPVFGMVSRQQAEGDADRGGRGSAQAPLLLCVTGRYEG